MHHPIENLRPSWETRFDPPISVCFRSQSAEQLSDDELPPDVDLTDPFFAEEMEKTENSVVADKKKGGKRKKKGKRKGDDLETEEDRRKKVR